MSLRSEGDKSFAAAVLAGDPIEEAIDWIKKNKRPEDVFPENELREWALENGLTEE